MLANPAGRSAKYGNQNFFDISGFPYLYFLKCFPCLEEIKGVKAEWH